MFCKIPKSKSIQILHFHTITNAFAVIRLARVKYFLPQVISLVVLSTLLLLVPMNTTYTPGCLLVVWGVHESWRCVKCQDHACNPLSKLKRNHKVSKSSLTKWPTVSVNNLLKLLEQLLHKIKANRRREIVLQCARGGGCFSAARQNVKSKRCINANRTFFALRTPLNEAQDSLIRLKGRWLSDTYLVSIRGCADGFGEDVSMFFFNVGKRKLCPLTQ